MKNSRIVSNFSKLTDAGFYTKAETISTAMTGNANFPNPTPAVADITTAVNAYGTALTAAQNRDRTAIAQKNKRRKELEDLLRQLGSSVTTTANGDTPMLLSSGFDLVKVTQPAVLTKPENIQVTDGINAGELVVSVSAVKGAKSYVHQYSTEPDANNWTAVTSTSSKYTFKNLQGVKRYWCRVAAVGPNDQVVFSDALSRVVQ